jgi:hypothetical protein
MTKGHRDTRKKTKLQPNWSISPLSLSFFWWFITRCYYNCTKRPFGEYSWWNHCMSWSGDWLDQTQWGMTLLPPHPNLNSSSKSHMLLESRNSSSSNSISISYDEFLIDFKMQPKEESSTLQKNKNKESSKSLILIPCSITSECLWIFIGIASISSRDFFMEVDITCNQKQAIQPSTKHISQSPNHCEAQPMTLLVFDLYQSSIPSSLTKFYSPK